MNQVNSHDYFVECPNCVELIHPESLVCRFCDAGLRDFDFLPCHACGEMVRKGAVTCKFCLSEVAIDPAKVESEVWKGLDSVREHPSKYIGSTGPRGVHRLIWGIIDNAVDEAVVGYCKNISVTLNSDDSVTITDDGRGLSTEIIEKTNKSILEAALTSLWGLGRFRQGKYVGFNSDVLHGLGLGVVNALCECLEVENCNDGSISRQVYVRGKLKTGLQNLGATDNHGTSITLWPDREIFYDFDANKHPTSVTFDWDVLVPRLREIAFLNKGLAISLTDKRSSNGVVRKERFCFANGIRDYVECLNLARSVFYKPPIYFERERDDIAVECALQWTDATEKIILSFANNIGTAHGGTHLNGFYQGLTKAFNNYSLKNGLIEEHGLEVFNEEDLTEGLTVVVAVRIPQPRFAGQTMEYLANGEVEKFTEMMVYKAMFDWLELNKSIAKQLVIKAVNVHRHEESKIGSI